MMVDLSRETWTWRPRPRNGAADAAVRLLQSAPGCRRRGGALGGAELALLSPRTSSIAATTSSAMAKTSCPRATASGTGASPRTIWSRTTTNGSTTRASPARPATSRARRSKAETSSRDRALASIRCRRLTKSIVADKFTAATKELGYHPFPQPAGILSEAYKDLAGNTRGACLYCGFCTRYRLRSGGQEQLPGRPHAGGAGNWQVRDSPEQLRLQDRDRQHRQGDRCLLHRCVWSLVSSRKPTSSSSRPSS